MPGAVAETVMGSDGDCDQVQDRSCARSCDRDLATGTLMGCARAVTEAVAEVGQESNELCQRL